MAKLTGPACETDFLRAAHALEGDLAGRAAATDYLRSTAPALWDESEVWAASPVILDQEEVGVLETAARTMSSIMEKLMARYHRDRQVRSLFSLPPEVERLTLVPTGHRTAVPLSRIDLFFDRRSHDFTITSITTGGVDGMARSAEAARAVQRMGAYRELARKHQLRAFDAVEGLVITLLHTYGRWSNVGEGHNHPKNPALAVVDVADSPRAAESAYVIERLREYGCYAHVTTPSKLRVTDVDGIEQLIDDHGPLNCVWLRATAQEALDGMEGGFRTLLDATRRGLVCTIGGYRSWPCSTKGFLEALQAKEFRLLLTREENEFVERHVDETHVIDTTTDISQFYDQDEWVLRPSAGNLFGEVLAGVDMSRSQWRSHLVKAIKRRDAVQRRLPDQRMDALAATCDPQDPTSTNALSVVLGLYVFEGKLGGVRAVGGAGSTTTKWGYRSSLGCLELLDAPEEEAIAPEEVE